ncbi:MAG TPA: oligopeptide/dipeptide ABC transporter ATP-binding protein, partial [Acidimicrobiales bacterium]|nr:oligopeptide/dipeptide ABC transporter ATP-binding protein [Acidimicrobiales bacterium]
EEIYASATHPYTQALLSAVPVADPDARGSRARIILAGEPPDPAAPPPGCRFHPRCWKATERCTQVEPALVDRTPPHPSACHYAAVAAAPLRGDEELHQRGAEDQHEQEGEDDRGAGAHGATLPAPGPGVSPPPPG